MRYLAAAGAAVTCAAALVLLYAGLYDLALRGGTAPEVAWLYPLMVDGPVAVGYGTAYALRDKKGRFYAWAVVVAFAAVSAWAQYRHAVEVDGDPWVAVIPSVSAPVALHLVALLARFERGRKPTVKARPEPQPVSRPEPTSLRAVPQPKAIGRGGPQTAEGQKLLAMMLANGRPYREVEKKAVADAEETTTKTVYRWLVAREKQAV